VSSLLKYASRVEIGVSDEAGKYTKLGEQVADDFPSFDEILQPPPIIGYCSGPVLSEISFTKASPRPMTDLRTLKPGDRAVYNEDGGYMVVEIVANGCTEKKEEFRLRVLGVLVPSPMLGNCEPGHEFDVFQLCDGYYAGRWHLRTFDDFAGGYEERRAALAPYEKTSP
jgi:hypothetical protein